MRISAALVLKYLGADRNALRYAGLQDRTRLSEAEVQRLVELVRSRQGDKLVAEAEADLCARLEAIRAQRAASNPSR